MLQNKVHRVFVVDEEGKLTRLITQSRVLHLLWTMQESIPIVQKTLRELGIGMKRALAVKQDLSAFRAFKLMFEQVILFLSVLTLH